MGFSVLVSDVPKMLLEMVAVPVVLFLIPSVISYPLGQVACAHARVPVCVCLCMCLCVCVCLRVCACGLCLHPCGLNSRKWALSPLQKCPDPVWHVITEFSFLLHGTADLVPVAQGLGTEPRGFSEKQGLANIECLMITAVLVVPVAPPKLEGSCV